MGAAMSDPTGTAGIRNQNDPDMLAIVHGGPKFAQRMEQLGRAKDAHDEALANLELGKSAAAAHTHAFHLQSEAKNAHEQAAKALADATSKATATRNEAIARATRIVGDAQTQADRIKAEAEQLKATAKADAERLQGEAQALKDEAQAWKDAAIADRNETSRLLTTANIEKAQIESDRLTVNRRRERLLLARDKLATAIKEADGHVFGI